MEISVFLISFACSSLPQNISTTLPCFPIDTFDRENAASAVMMIPIPRGGLLEAIDGVDEARAVEGVTEVTMTVRPGRKQEPHSEATEKGDA